MASISNPGLRGNNVPCLCFPTLPKEHTRTTTGSPLLTALVRGKRALEDSYTAWADRQPNLNLVRTI